MDGYCVNDGQPEFFVKIGESVQFLHLEHKCADGFRLGFPSSLYCTELLKLCLCLFISVYKTVVPSGVFFLALHRLRIFRNAAFCQFGHNLNLLKQALNFSIDTRAVCQRSLHQSAVLKDGAFAVEDGVKGGNEPCLDGFFVQMWRFAFEAVSKKAHELPSDLPEFETLIDVVDLFEQEINDYIETEEKPPEFYPTALQAICEAFKELWHT